ncbi:MAG TPA: nucleoside deaminase [Candidatus Faecousia faecipullorum]|nr:nucleoside deaminase [Candidatus Faecousia faecipullorum]
MDERFMDEALKLAREAFDAGEVPVGCVITRGETIVGRGRNRREAGKNALCHAELEAINEACKTLGGWRLWECTLYVTLEPCPMCAGAIVNARIPRVVYGAGDPKCGAVRSRCALFDMGFNHRPQVEAGVREAECGALLTEFFRNLRVVLKSRPKWRKKPTEET